MEIILEIDEKEVKFKSSGAVAPRYMMQFGRDLLKDMLKMGVNMVNFEELTESQQLEWMRKNIDFQVFFDIAWTFAKTADKSIPEPMTWLDSFESFPIFEIMQPIQELLNITFQPKKKVTIK